MSEFTPAPAPTGAPADPTAPPAAPSAATPLRPAAAKEEYRTAAGCLTLSLVSLAALGVLVIFVVLFGDIRM